MKIITSYPVIYRNNVINRGGSEFSNITATSNKDSIKSYQTWYNKQSPKTPLKVDGQWGPKTSAAWDEKGQVYEKQMFGAAQDVQNTVAGLFGGMPAAPLPENITVSSPTGEQKKGMFWDKLKGAFVVAKEAGVVDAGENIAKDAITLKGKTGTKNTPPAGQPNAIPPTKPGLSKTAKILIGVGIFLVVAGIVYKVTRSKKG